MNHTPAILLLLFIACLPMMPELAYRMIEGIFGERR